ncbi:MAG: hypothetical protein WCT77_04835 [Bacteroidota bacterium]
MSKWKLKIGPGINPKKLKEILVSKSFIGSIILATALWGYNALNSEYRPVVDIPLTVKLPTDRAIENVLPPKISVKVKGNGWDIFYLMFLTSAAKCNIDLSGKNIKDSLFTVQRADIFKGLEYLMNVEPTDVIPESLVLKTGSIDDKTIPVLSRIDIKPREGFVIVGDVKVEPQYIRVSGNEKIIKSLKKWFTSTYLVKDCYKSQSFVIPLMDSLKETVKLSGKTVTVSFDVQAAAELTIHDVEIKIRGGGSLPKNNYLLPSRINITVRGGVDELTNFDRSKVSAVVEFSDIINDSLGILVPKIIVEDKTVKIINVEPGFLYHRIRVKDIRNNNILSDKL